MISFIPCKTNKYYNNKNVSVKSPFETEHNCNFCDVNTNNSKK